MKYTSEEQDRKPDDTFWTTVTSAASRVLLLDYDGTLAPFRADRYKAFPYPGIREILNHIIAMGKCRVVIVSGRWTRDLPPLLGLETLPEIWGSHGIERLFPDGQYIVAPLPEEQVRGLAEADERVMASGMERFKEQKPGCLALHWRGLDPKRREELILKAEEELKPIEVRSGLVLKEFDGGLELRTPGFDKGNAVRTVLSEQEPDTVCAYLGDDLTDEDAFKALDDRGLGILVRDQWRPTAASAWLKPPEELIEFLEKWAVACT